MTFGSAKTDIELMSIHCGAFVVLELTFCSTTADLELMWRHYGTMVVLEMASAVPKPTLTSCGDIVVLL